MSEQFNYNRRRFFGAAAITVAAAQLGTLASANAQSSTGETPQSGAHTSFS
jgi:nitrous oxide reductase